MASLVNPDNEYSQLRLAHYATGDANDWDHLPEWNPPVDVIAASELDAPGGASTYVMSPQAAPLDAPGDVTSEDDPALVALGEQAFHRYPVQVDPYFAPRADVARGGGEVRAVGRRRGGCRGARARADGRRQRRRRRDVLDVPHGPGRRRARRRARRTRSSTRAPAILDADDEP